MIDVLVVGAGPAGATAATRLARAGARVLLVDRARFPRDKLCGDSLNPGALALLEYLGLARGVRAVGLPVDGMVVTGAGGVSVRASYPAGTKGLSITRRDLDAYLLADAAASGVHVEEGVAVRGPLIETSDGRTVVRGAILVGRDGRGLRVPAPVTIAADGRRSTLAFALGLARHPPRPRRWAIGGYFGGVAGCGRFGEMHIRPHHYLGVASVPGCLTNACLVTEARAGFDDPGGLLSSTLRADPLLADRFSRARLAAPVSVLGPLAVDARIPGTQGLLLAGDAAGFIDPMTGDGVRLALTGAVLAAEAALAMLEHPGTAGHEQLARHRRQALWHKQQANRCFRAIVASPRGIEMGARLASVAPGLFRRLISFSGDVFFDPHGLTSAA